MPSLDPVLKPTRLVIVLFAATLGSLAADPASSVVPRPDKEILHSRLAQLETLAKSLTAKTNDPAGAVASIGEMLMFRSEVMAEINEKHGLTTVTGVETQDHVDDAVVRALKPIVERGRQNEGAPPSEDDLVYFSVILGDPPPLSKSPVGFMVLEYGNMALSTLAALRNDPTIGEEEAQKLAIRFLKTAVDLYHESHVDALAVGYADVFRQSTVIVRLRCEADGSPYRISSQRNKLSDTDQVSTVYLLKSNATYEELELEFPLRYLSRLQEVSEKQKLKRKPKRARSQGMDPD